MPLPSLSASFQNSLLQIQVVFLVTLKSPLPARTVTPALLSGVVWNSLVVRTSSKIQGPEANLSCLCNSKRVTALIMSTLQYSPGKSHGWRSLVGCSPWDQEELDTTERLHFHFSLSCIGGRNGNPLQCSCLENPRDGGAWWAAVYGVTQSQT